MIFLLIVKIILLVAALLFAVASAGANEQKDGERCMVLSGMFICALVVLVIIT